MSLARRASFIGKSTALWVAMAVCVLCAALGALGFFTAAFFIWVSGHLGPAAAACICGVALLVVAGLVALGVSLTLRHMNSRQPSLAEDALGVLMLGLRFATLVVRRDPRKAMVAAVIAGALAEYFTSSRPTKD